MFDWSQAIMKEISVHQLIHGESPELKLSEESLQIDNSITRELLQSYFLNGLTERPDFYSFTFSNGEAALNPLVQFSKSVFEGSETLQQASRHIAKHLFQSSTHHQIKSGDLYVVLFDHIAYEDEVINAIGLFKSETKDSFLQLMQNGTNYNMQHDIGLHIKKLDKGCLIYNVSTPEDYIVSIIDRSSSKTEAKFWKEDFLNVQTRKDEYHQTLQYMNLAQSYIGHQLTEDVEIDKADQIDLLNRSGQYFKENDSFEKEDFKYRVLQDQNVIESFDKYQDAYQAELNIELPQSYSISPQAVKKGAKDFKSVLKLDKNFHIYIHGDRRLIESGRDEDGRKWYKVYYEEEK